MPVVLEETQVDPIEEQLDAQLAAREEEELEKRLLADPPSTVGDLSNGGNVGAAEVYPTLGGERQEKGRPVARRLWTWNGSETLVPLAWTPNGKVHDGGRRYLTKRFCLCCRTGGFRATEKGLRCPQCEKNRCLRCNGGLDRTKVNTLGNGKTIKGWIIPAFYLRKEDVPFPERFYGPIDCFLSSCPRRNGMGFKTEQDMRLHARSRHRVEYQIEQDVMQAAKSDELESLRRQVAALTVAKLEEKGPTPEEGKRVQRRRRKKSTQP